MRNDYTGLGYCLGATAKTKTKIQEEMLRCFRGYRLYDKKEKKGADGQKRKERRS